MLVAVDDGRRFGHLSSVDSQPAPATYIRVNVVVAAVVVVQCNAPFF